MPQDAERSNPDDFSLVLGGPLYRFFAGARMLRPPLELLPRRIIGVTLVTWLPLLLLTLLERQALSGIRVPFLGDVQAQARFLLALPLLFMAEISVHRRLRSAVTQLQGRGIVRDEDRPRYAAIIASTRRMVGSVAAESFLIVLVFTVGHYVWRENFATLGKTWYASPTGSGQRLSLAGHWYAWVSLPIFQFVLLRWYYRVILWFIFLWRVSRLDLRLVPTHPDHGGGLAFLGASTQGFGPLLTAHGCLLSGMIAGWIFHEGATLLSFKLEILAGLVVAMLPLLVPLTLFLPAMQAARRKGLREYGTFANRYVTLFDQKWIRGGAPVGEPLMGSSDIQSLADLSNGYQIVRGMGVLPFGKTLVLQLAGSMAVPLVPLVLTMMPLEELLTRLFQLLF